MRSSLNYKPTSLASFEAARSGESMHICTCVSCAVVTREFVEDPSKIRRRDRYDEPAITPSVVGVCVNRDDD